MLLSSRPRAKIPRFTVMRFAVGFALFGSVIAVAIPSFVREVHASRLVEPIDGLRRIGVSAVAYAHLQPVGRGFPASAPMTPAVPPRGRCVVDPPDAWDDPTWRALDFRPVRPGLPHCFAFAFDSALAPSRSTFKAHAHGDLDGDGISSTFQISGQYVEGDAHGPTLDPGMVVESEVE